MTNLAPSVLRNDDEHEKTTERGATLFIIAAVLLLLMLLGGLAVDLSFKADRGQDLQSAVDAAALAAVKEYNASGNQVAAQAVVDAVLAQNGEGLTGVVGFNSLTEVTVTVTDSTHAGLFSGFTGDSTGVSRTATASQDICTNNCNQEVEAPEITYPIAALGNGDGFTPIEVGNRYYAINHHEDTVDCVSKDTQSQCWGERKAFKTGIGIPNAYRTMNSHHPTLIGTKIYFTVSNSNNRHTWLTCFNTANDQPCDEAKYLGKVGGTVMAVPNAQSASAEIYLFASGGSVHCHRANGALTECSGYDGPVDDGNGDERTGLESSLRAIPGWNVNDSTAWNRDMRIHGSRMYMTLAHNVAISGSSQSVYVHCWDTAGDESCPGWGQGDGYVELPDTNFARNQRLFFSHDTFGNRDAICIFGRAVLDCWSLTTGSSQDTRASKVRPIRDLMLVGIGEDVIDNNHNGRWGASNNSWPAHNYYHPPTNRMFMPNSKGSTTWCYDFTLQEKCPTDAATGASHVHETQVGGHDTQTYAYIADSTSDACLIGLGDESLFHTLKPDMSGPCDISGGSVEIEPCPCASGVSVWPDLKALQTAGVNSFEVRVTDLSNNPVAPSTTDPDEWHDLLTGDLSLANLTHPGPKLLVHFNITIDLTAGNLWDLGTPPTFVIQGQTIAPYLVD